MISRDRLLRASVVFSLFFIVLFLLLFINIDDIGLVVFVLFIVLFLGAILTGLNVYALLMYRKYKLDEYKHREHNICEYYHYQKFFEPPDMDT